jgi:hypothetical protein
MPRRFSFETRMGMMSVGTLHHLLWDGAGSLKTLTAYACRRAHALRKVKKCILN